MARRKLNTGELGTIHTTKLDKREEGKHWYRANARVGTVTGVSKQIQATGLGVEAAKDNLRALAKERANQRTTDTLGQNTTVKELAEMYIESTAKRSTPSTPQTRELYRRVIRIHLPTGVDGKGIADMKLIDLGDRNQAVRIWLEEKHTEVPSTSKTLRSILMGAFKWCEGRGVKFWDQNPAGGADIAVQVKHKPALTIEHIKELRRRAEQWQGDTRPTPVTAILDLLAATGMRIGETLALRWQDMDLDKGTVTIAGTVVDREGKQSEGGGTIRQPYGKTAKAHRTLTLPGWIIPQLMESMVMSDNELLFPNAWGGVLGPNGFRRKFREIRGDDLKWVTPKSYRAAVATIISRSMDDYSAARQLGHESPSVTSKSYITRADDAGDNTMALDLLNPNGSE